MRGTEKKSIGKIEGDTPGCSFPVPTISFFFKRTFPQHLQRVIFMILLLQHYRDKQPMGPSVVKALQTTNNFRACLLQGHARFYTEHNSNITDMLNRHNGDVVMGMCQRNHQQRNKWIKLRVFIKHFEKKVKPFLKGLSKNKNKYKGADNRTAV